MKRTPLNYMYVQSFLIKYILLLQIPVFTGWSSSPFSDPVILSKILITDRFMNKLYYMLQDTHFKASNTEPLIYRFGSAYVYANVMRMSWSTKCGQTFIQVQWLL